MEHILRLAASVLALSFCGIVVNKSVFAQDATDGLDPTSAKRPAGKGAAGSINEETQVKEKVQRKTQKVVKNEFSGTGLGIFGGADLGLVFTSPSNKTYKLMESSQLGFAPVFKFGASVFTQRIILDAALGLHYSRYSGKIISLPLADDFGDVSFVPFNESYTRNQLGMHAEAAARLRIKQAFQVGLLGSLIFSTESAGFLSITSVDTPEKFIALIGPQFIYETNLSKNISRFGASFLVSLTGTNRNSYIANLHAGIGSFIINPRTVVTTKKETRTRTKVTREVIQLKAQSADITDNVSFIFDSQMVNFKLNSAELNPRSGQFISALGEIFARENELWDKLRIEGHTDSRGSVVYNKKLSTMRARSVADQLIKSGVAKEKLESEGLGSSQLLVSPEQNDVDYARNRRVEIKILGLKDARALKKYVEEIQGKFFGARPEQRAIPIPQPTTPESSAPQAPVWDPGLETPPAE
jgi:outer membrane protein OmpA-like peptidoglycan-associated protein